MLALAHDYRVMNADRGWIYYPLIHIGLVLPDPLIELLKTKVQKPRMFSVFLFFLFFFLSLLLLLLLFCTPD
jgi:hypothetical protein